MKQRRQLWIGLVLLLANVGSTAQQSGPVVETATGQVRGAIDGDVASFKGIPFAAPPIGDLRWRAPQPVEPWDGVREATEFGAHCPQAPFFNQGTFGADPDEDCLYLNIWAPSEHNAENLLPVMFWIHGGGFVNGGTADPLSDGSKLAREGVVLVSANYRLGRFGFFAHPALTDENADDGRLGNYAIMDQIAALGWVRDNISAFGGDPDRVTIFGNSAGGSSVHCLMTAPLAHGLFAGAISQSGLGRSDEDGFPFRPLAAAFNTQSAEAEGLQFATKHGIEGDGPEALAALRALPAEEVVSGLHMGTRRSDAFGGPIVDGKVLPSSIEDAYANGRQARVPLIVGGNDADGFYPWGGGSRDQVFAQFGELRPEAEALYDPEGDEDLQRYGTYANADLLFLEPARNLARKHSATDYPTWVYRFSYVPESLREARIGAWHASECAFIFDTLTLSFAQEPTESDTLAASQLRSYWLAFARTGVPSPEGLPKWPRYDLDSDVLIDFQFKGPVIGPDPARERLDLAEAVAEDRRAASGGR